MCVRARVFVCVQSTRGMRDELDEAGLGMANESEQVNLAIAFSEWVSSYLPNVQESIAWLKVFKEVDNVCAGDGSNSLSKRALVDPRSDSRPACFALTRVPAAGYVWLAHFR